MIDQPKQTKIDLNSQFKQALDLLENTTKNVFITGKAGTGKSTLLSLFRSQTKKNIVVIAPTGVAALNVGGQTIHSFFGFRPNTTPQRIRRLNSDDKKAAMYHKLDAIVIDEISMVRADLLDCIDRFMRLNGKSKNLPFGGVQMIFFGDLYQLPPVVTNAERDAFFQIYETPYFFSSKVFVPSPTRGGDRGGRISTNNNQIGLDIQDELSFQLDYVELDHVYRQSDQEFIGLLNAIRNNLVTEEHLTLLNSRVIPDFRENNQDFYVYLTPTNALAEKINADKLWDVESPVITLTGSFTGNFDIKQMPTHEFLEIKAGAQVMLLNNDQKDRWVNGSIGQVIGLKDQSKDSAPLIEVLLSNGQAVDVEPFTWEMYKYSFNPNNNQVVSEIAGTFTQYPLKLAWAVTIHKSQGKTFNRVILDIGNGAFAHGQTYVALSRCTSLNGLVLKRPVLRHHIFMDETINDYLSYFVSSGQPLYRYVPIC